MKLFPGKPLAGLALLSLLVMLSGFAGAADKPLLMEGKKSLYQRVLSVPEARLFETPAASENSSEIIPFSVLYVYEKDDDWLKVGYDSFGGIAGWVKSDKAIAWNQALTVSFKDPQDTQRVMMFNNRESLEKLVNDYDRAGYQALYEAVVNDRPPQDSPVIAIQPEAHLEIRDNFYLVPIKQHEDVYLGNEQARLLKIASVPLDDAGDAAALKNAGSGNRSYRSGIHFVIDSTQSMGPYIDRTREAVAKVYSAIERQGLTNQVSFGLTAYRDNLEQVPELEYLTRRFVSLQQGTNFEQFFEGVNSLSPSQVSSRDFREDAYAGIRSAIEDSDWEQFDARYVVLITDAGPRESYDSLGATRLSAQALRQLAYDRGVSIWVLHLRTPSVAADHETAESLYKQLSYFPGIGDFYYGVRLGEVDEFGNVLEVLANQITQQVLATTNGVPPLPLPQRGGGQTQLAQLQDRVAKLGNALRMRYIQKESGQPLPSVFDAWMVDRDFQNPERSAVDVRVLLTRDQLSDLKNVMQQVLELAEEGVLSPQNFIDDLKSLAATVSRDPSAVAGSTSGAGTNLADMGYMREYIEDLPYTGEVMNLTLQSWEEWSAKVQIEFMHRLESKINYYQALHDHTDLWVTPGGGPVTGNSVFPVALDLLP
ncbi:MAG: VWA domain-containing protein [Gammaproteobacteria bacterium]|nr:VWA domain-containing protein [Gammaproteobacteria bacterium]MDH3449992.1 VWA domain-containing protein [Gammaproteobacteria bacterium]